MQWIIGRLKEPSTYLGAFAIASAFFHIDLSPEQQDAVIELAIALAGGGLVVTKG